MKREYGFTLIELMIVVAIIGILAAIALPAYNTYIEKSKYSEVVIAVGGVKSSMEVCLQANDYKVSDCDTAAKIGIKLSDAERGDNVLSILITNVTGEITGTGKDENASTYILKPVAVVGFSQGNWTKSGTCIANGVC